MPYMEKELYDLMDWGRIEGIVYSEENLELLKHELADVDELSILQDAIDRIKADGFEAELYDGRTAYQWAEYLIELAEHSLTQEDKEYLENVRAFWCYSK